MSTVITSSYITPNAANSTFCTDLIYPTQWDWAATSDNRPTAATSGTLRIEQWRNGSLLATYQYLGQGPSPSPVQNSYLNPAVSCGAFTRTPYRNWAPGDIYYVYPAVYQGINQQPYFGPMFDLDSEYSGGPSTWAHCTNIQIIGVTVDGVKPVIVVDSNGCSNNTYGNSAIYFDTYCANIIIQNIDIMATPDVGLVGKSGIYLNGVTNLTLQDMRIYGFVKANANGIFGTNNNAGTLLLDRVDLYENGGDGGPEHNIYINSSQYDTSWTVHAKNSWFHKVYYGHCFKSRAQVNILEGCYFEGGLPFGDNPQSEAFAVDIPEGGIAVLRNNIIVKNASGPDSNGVCVGFGEDLSGDGRTFSVTYENNTFIAFSKYYDPQQHLNYPMLFYYPPQIPTDVGFPIPSENVIVRRNVFCGFCVPYPGYDDFQRYRGDIALTVGFADLNQDFSLVTNYVSDNNDIVGTVSYEHLGTSDPVRRYNNIGSRDWLGNPEHTAKFGLNNRLVLRQKVKF